MNWWKRTFGLHPVDMLIHFVTGMFIVIGLVEATGSDAMAMLGTACLFALYAWRRQRAIAAFPLDPAFNSGEVKLAELDAQAEELHELRGRMAELEERLDFTERMLAQQREPEQLGRPK